MSNHYHIVLRVDPAKVARWSDEEVAERWQSVCPSYSKLENGKLRALHKSALLDNTERMLELRQRLASLSWFMRFINEPLARLANKEDNCTGRFWEGRFKSQQLLDENAILAAMVYVDLNPVRAGIANDVTEAKHTSLSKRLTLADNNKPLTAINQPYETLPFDYTRADYIELARWTVAVQQHKRPMRSKRIPFGRSEQSTTLWIDHYLPSPGHWQRANGSFQALKDYARDIGQCWIKTRSLHLQQ